MQPDEGEFGSPEQWLAYARSDVILARSERSSPCLRSNTLIAAFGQKSALVTGECFRSSA